MKKKFALAFAALFMMVGYASAFTIEMSSGKKPHKEKDKDHGRHHEPPPPPPRVVCKFVQPECDRHDNLYKETYRNDQRMLRGSCRRGRVDGTVNFYCSNGDKWMVIDYYKGREDRIDCYDPRERRMVRARSIRQCEDWNR